MGILQNKKRHIFIIQNNHRADFILSLDLVFKRQASFREDELSEHHYLKGRHFAHQSSSLVCN